MKLLKTSMMLAAAASMGVTFNASAAGTTAGTSVENTVTLNYKVGNIDQTPTEGKVTFVVDNKIDLTFITQESTTVQVTPNGPFSGATYVASFQLTNNGNQTQDYSFNIAEHANGTVNLSGSNTVEDNATLGANLNVFVESGATAGYQAGEDTQTYVNDLAPDASIQVYAVINDSSTVDASLVDTNIGGIELTAITQDQSVNGANQTVISNNHNDAFNPSVEQIVFADSGNDAIAQAEAAYEVVSAIIEATKSVVVLNDPICASPSNNFPANNDCQLANYQPKAIPGSTLSYTITVKNTGRADATDVAVVDNVDSINGFEDGQVSIVNIAYTAGTAVNSSDATKVDITLPLLKQEDGAASTDDEATIVFTTKVE